MARGCPQRRGRNVPSSEPFGLGLPETAANERIAVTARSGLDTGRDPLPPLALWLHRGGNASLQMLEPRS